MQMELHHTAYITGMLLWDYPNTLLMALCRPCHEWRQSREDAFRVAIGEMTRCMAPEELEDEVWRILDEIRTANAARKAGLFS